MSEQSAALILDGYIRRSADFLRMTGEDRFRFLNGQVTCDVAKLEPGDGVYGFFTTAKGRIEADVTVVAEADALLLHLPAGQGPTIVERLRKYVIVDRVEIEPVDRVAFAVVGPHADAARGVLPEGASSLTRPDGFNVWLEPEDAASTESAWQAVGARSLDEAVWELHRIQSGRPRWGTDFGLDHFPKETGLDDAVSYTKGCYLGQEVVARIHYRGGVQRRLRGLRLDAGSPQELKGAQVLAGGKVVGRLGSVAAGPNGALGLAILHDKAEVGSTVELQGSDGELGRATVAELPFDLSS